MYAPYRAWRTPMPMAWLRRGFKDTPGPAHDGIVPILVAIGIRWLTEEACSHHVSPDGSIQHEQYASQHEPIDANAPSHTTRLGGAVSNCLHGHGHDAGRMRGHKQPLPQSRHSNT
ncbi:hypothetical protein BIFGAL_04353 [Bifidobacterium gallicum DSM 20093 = LMG 11596]|uniref:Uncharacterized protein n=1 Tax=Bifidobacterium gallicum DSM 20093 = LMG 11596 TaxID=561180 RepID=D1NWU7_9BIFI|nr:hypothetical protein BIFGAL_04353 [Bifidobacterium gallicum DSM 20093 = LMG 11596]